MLAYWWVNAILHKTNSQQLREDLAQLMLEKPYRTISLNESHLNTKSKSLENRDTDHLLFAQSYAGINLWHNFSFHFQGLGRSRTRPKDLLVFKEQITEYAFLQLGNPNLSNNLAAIGTIDLPFGLNDRPMEQLFLHLKKSYWPRRRLGAHFAQEK